MSEQTTPETTNTKNPLLERVKLPGETHRLPSGGLFYHDGELDADVTNGEVHVYPMTTIDEVVTRSPDKLFSGEAIVEVFSRCIPSIKKPKELLQKDVDFLMLVLRKVSYGEETQMSYTHSCEEATEHTYTINMNNFIQEAKSLDPTTVNKVFSVTLPNDQVVKLHPIKFKDVVDMMQNMPWQEGDEQEYNEQTDYLLKTLISIIDTVDDIDDKSMIEEWIRQIPAGWAHQISNAIDQTTNWGPSFETTIECKDCGEEVTIEAPMNPVSFFT